MRDFTSQSWVIYSMRVKNFPKRMRAVCAQPEWELMDRDKPGFYTLVQAGIENEGEAERLARGTSGEERPRNVKRRVASLPEELSAPTGKDAAATD